MHRSADLGNERVNVLDLEVHVVRQRVAAGAPTAPGVVVDSQVLRQLRSERRVLRAVVKTAADQDHGRPASHPFIRD
jgi:hypothetical protein